jgi:hypothetical protein
MTWYHGPGVNRFVFTGFAPWVFQRQDFIGLTDFVLQEIWGLTREPVDRSSLAGGAGRARPAAVRAVRARGTPGERVVY